MKDETREFPLTLKREKRLPSSSLKEVKNLGRLRSYDLSALERLTQVTASLLGLIFLSPLLLVIAIVIKATSRGPVFYRGERVGKDEKKFLIFKFRTLQVGAEKEIGARLLDKNDHYYTPVGRFLKRTKLDEIPQLINVIKGDMNLVGPRPIRPIFWQRFREEIPNYRKRFLVRPGITGLAQIRGGYFTHPRNKLRYEGFYLNHRSFLMDIKLIGLTLLKLLNRWITLGFVLLLFFLFVSFVPAEVQSQLYVKLIGIRFNLLHLLVLILGCWLVAKKLPSHRLYLYRSSMNLPILCFIIVSAVSALFSEVPVDALRGTAYYAVTGFFITILIINTEITKAFARRGAQIVALCCVALSTLGLLKLVVDGNMAMAGGQLSAGEGFLAAPGITSTMGSPIVLAAYLILGIPLLMTELTHCKSREARDFWVVCATISFVGILLTKSFTGLLGLLLTLAVYMTNCLRSKLVNAFIFFLAVSAIILSMGVNFTFHNNGSPNIAKVGSEFYSRLQRLPVEKIFIGVGSRSLQEVKSGPLLEETDEDPLADYLLDNGHLRLVLENGILGWGIIMWMLLGALQTIHKAHKAESDPYTKSLLWAAFSAILGFLISMNGFNAFSSITLQFFFWSLVGVAVATAIHHGKNGGFRILWRFGSE